MTVRFYFSWRPSPLSPTPSTWWNATSSGITGSLVRVPEGNRNREGMVQVKSVATNPYNMLSGSFITEPLTAGLMALGTPFRLSTAAYMTGTSPDAMLSVTLRLLDSTGAQKTVLYSGPTNTTTATTGNVKNRKLPTVTTGATRRFEDTLTATANIAAGDRIELAIGVRWVTAGTSLNFFWRPTANERAVGDLPLVNDYVLPADYALATSLRDWIEFGTDNASTGAEVTLSDGEVQFGDVSAWTLNKGSTLPFVDLTSIDGIDGAPIQLSSVTRQGSHGGYVTSEFEGFRTITLEGVMYSSPATTNTDLQTLKANFAPSVVDKPLYVGLDSETYMFWGKSQGLRYVVDRSRSYGVVRFQVQIICADPRKYWKMYVKTLVYPGWNTIALTGDRSTPALISLTNAGASTTTDLDLQLLNTEGTMYVRLPSLGVAEELLIDTGKRTAIVNGLTNKRNVLTFMTGGTASRWLDLEPGNNDIALTFNTGSNPSGFVRYRPAWW